MTKDKTVRVKWYRQHEIPITCYCSSSALSPTARGLYRQ